MESDRGGPTMESDRGGPPAEALGAAADPPQRPPSPGEESEAKPAGSGEPDRAAGKSEGSGGSRGALRAVYVCKDGWQDGADGPGGGFEVIAFRCFARACEAERVHLSTVPFGELDSGNPAVLDVFYRAGEAGVPVHRCPAPDGFSYPRTRHFSSRPDSFDGNARPFAGGESR